MTKLSDLPRRMLVSSISILAVFCFIFFAYIPWFQYITAAFVAALTGVAIWEYEQFAKAKGGKLILPAMIAVGVMQVLSFFIPFSNLPLLIFFIGFLVLIALHFNEKDGAVVDLAVSSFSLIYIAIPMGMLLGILYGKMGGQDGRWWVAYLLIVTKITDVGAYFGGSLWGRRKLAPMISPKKTVEGAIIGLVFAIGASLAFHGIGFYLGAVRFHSTWVESLALGLLLGCIGQFGDLSESLLKRDANKKDSNTLPGLGGVLDLLDSLLFNAFIVYYYLNYYLLN